MTGMCLRVSLPPASNQLGYFEPRKEDRKRRSETRVCGSWRGETWQGRTELGLPNLPSKEIMCPRGHQENKIDRRILPSEGGEALAQGARRSCGCLIP